uniref:RNA helicase n=1 Tax=Panagrolaimus sp. ES5 TaxID=591445 RepID=A0AC34FP12_9BILA
MYETHLKKDSSPKKLLDFTILNDLKAKRDSATWNKSSNKNLSSRCLNVAAESEKDHEFEKSKSTNNSTLSLHIAEYENSVEVEAEANHCKTEDLKRKKEKTNLFKKWEVLKQVFAGSSLLTENPFEFPRQQEDWNNYPEMMQFKASQRLSNPNEEDLNVYERKNTFASTCVQPTNIGRDIHQQRQHNNHGDFRRTTANHSSSIQFPATMASDENAFSGYRSIYEMPAQHIRLFSPWIFDESLQLTEIYKNVLNSSDQKLLRDALNEEKDDRRMMKLFDASIKILNEDRRAQDVLQKYLESSPEAGFMKNFIMLNDSKYNAFKMYSEQILNHPRCSDVIDRIAGILYLPSVVDYFSSSSESSYRSVADSIKKRLQNDTYTELWKLRNQLLFGLVRAEVTKRKPEWWYYEFLKACNTHPKSRVFAYLLDNNLKDTLNEYELELQQFCTPSVKKTSLEFVNDEEAPKKPRPQNLFGKLPTFITGEVANHYSLRGYQHELVAKAKSGLSTVICAPTGSGKTLVALDIIINHLRKQRHSGEIGRVVMFAPTIPLVNQQSEFLFVNMKPEFFVEKLSGVEKVSGKIGRAETLLRAHVVVMTPQIFINMLLSPLKQNRLYLNDFTMFVFDECHHCDEHHPYNILMNHVRLSNYKPQIVGLTASVGDGAKGKSSGRLDPQGAIEHMLELCARLECNLITSVRSKDNLMEMNSYISQPVDQIFSIRPKETDNFAHNIALLSDSIQNTFRKALEEAVQSNVGLNRNVIEFPFEEESGCKNGTCKTSMIYGSKLAQIKSQVHTRTNCPHRLFILKCITLLEICHFTLKNNELMPARLALSYMKERIDEFKLKEMASADLMAEEEFRAIQYVIQDIENEYRTLEDCVPQSNEKPILDKLLECIVEQYRIDKDSRILIFVESRKGCVKMAEYLQFHNLVKRTFGENKVNHLVSVNQASSSFGQTMTAQYSILKLFKSGKINIVVATSVAEEGLDVAECNLIIKYNNAGSEKSYIQRKGRARAKNSRSILLALSDKVEQQEYRNIMREYLMNECLQSLNCMGETQLKIKINEKKEKLMKILEEEQRRARELAMAFANTLYKIKCSTCGLDICYSNQVYRTADSQNICCNPDAWESTTVNQRFDKGYRNNVSALCGEWTCKCGKKRGEVIKYGEAFLPTLSADNIRLNKIVNGRETLEDHQGKYTWKIITSKYFATAPISSEQIRSMINAIYQYPEAFKNAQMNENKGILEAIRNMEKRTKRHRLQDD